MKQSPEMEIVYEIWPNDGDKWHVEVGPDRDGLGCVEIRYRDEQGRIAERMMYSPEISKLLGEAIVRVANDMLAKKTS